MVKASWCGGGRGMRVVHDPSDLVEQAPAAALRPETREQTVTEVIGVDLVKAQIRLAEGARIGTPGRGFRRRPRSC